LIILVQRNLILANKAKGVAKMLTQQCIINFPQGIPGFETYHEFEFIPEEESPVAQLIAVQEKHIRFIILHAEANFPGYVQEMQLHVDEENTEILKLNAETRTDIWVILTLNRRDVTKTTGNLRAPLMFNLDEGIGVQIILNNDQYLSNQPLFTEENAQPLQEGAVR